MITGKQIRTVSRLVRDIFMFSAGEKLILIWERYHMTELGCRLCLVSLYYLLKKKKSIGSRL